MLKNYKQFIFEAGLDLDLGGLGGDEKKKKETPPDPEKEIAKIKKKKRETAAKERAAELDAAESELQSDLKKAPDDFKEKFQKRLKDALDDDDRVIYHNLILDIQRYQMPLARQQQDEEIYDISPILKVLQTLNKNEYKG
jgi:hypothetical protein